MPRPTIADLRAMRGTRQLSMLRVETLEEAEAAARARIDMVSIPPSLMGPAFREVAPEVFAIPGRGHGELVTEEEYLGMAFPAILAGADAIYCAARMQTVQRLAEEGVPVCGHAGLIPSRCTWTGGFRAVGKTLESAQLVWRQVRALEAAGAFAAEIEVVPPAIAQAIAARTSLFLISMGAGPHCDAQYLFACDVLGENTGHVPRHARVYADFAAERARLQDKRIAAFAAYAGEVQSGAFPAPERLVREEAGVAEAFADWLDRGTA